MSSKQAASVASPATPIVVHFIGGPLDGQARQFDALPTSSMRAGAEHGGVEYLLYLFDVNDEAAWAFVARGTALDDVQARLSEELAATRTI